MDTGKPPQTAEPTGADPGKPGPAQKKPQGNQDTPTSQNNPPPKRQARRKGGRKRHQASVQKAVLLDEVINQRRNTAGTTSAGHQRLAGGEGGEILTTPAPGQGKKNPERNGTKRRKKWRKRTRPTGTNCLEPTGGEGGAIFTTSTTRKHGSRQDQTKGGSFSRDRNDFVPSKSRAPSWNSPGTSDQHQRMADTRGGTGVGTRPAGVTKVIEVLSRASAVRTIKSFRL